MGNTSKPILPAFLLLNLLMVNPLLADWKIQETDSIGEALKHFKPTQSCDKVKPSKPVPGKRVFPMILKPDVNCAVSASIVKGLLNSAKTLLVDTRGQADFASHHIDGAINIDAFELGGKPFLADKDIVLTGDGKGEEQLYMECNRLKGAGFKNVKVMRGGMPAWIASGYGITGQAPGLNQLRSLTAEELWQESQFKFNRVFATKSQQAIHQRIKGSILVKADAPETVMATIRQHQKQNNSHSIAAVILVTTNDVNAVEIGKALSPVPLLVYSGSAQAFTDHLSRQPAVWAAYANGPKQPSGCKR